MRVHATNMFLYVYVYDSMFVIFNACHIITSHFSVKDKEVLVGHIIVKVCDEKYDSESDIIIDTIRNNIKQEYHLLNRNAIFYINSIPGTYNRKLLFP